MIVIALCLSNDITPETVLYLRRVLKPALVVVKRGGQHNFADVVITNATLTIADRQAMEHSMKQKVTRILSLLLEIEHTTTTLKLSETAEILR